MMLRNLKAKRCADGVCIHVDETVASECQVKMLCGEYEFETIASPMEFDELATGHLIAKGLIDDFSDISSIDRSFINDVNMINVKAINKKANPAVIKEISLDPEAVYSMNDKVKENSELFDRTGAFHYSFIFKTDGELLYSAHDVGRMNAIDKVIGKASMEMFNFEDKVLYTTGRIAKRAVEKAKNAGISMVISKAPPTYEAIRTAKEHGIGIIGFSRQRRYNIYTDEEDEY